MTDDWSVGASTGSAVLAGRGSSTSVPDDWASVGASAGTTDTGLAGSTAGIPPGFCVEASAAGSTSPSGPAALQWQRAGSNQASIALTARVWPAIQHHPHTTLPAACLMRCEGCLPVCTACGAMAVLDTTRADEHKISSGNSTSCLHSGSLLDMPANQGNVAKASLLDNQILAV